MQRTWTPRSQDSMSSSPVTDVEPTLQPLYLLADSQLLFWRRQGRLLLEEALEGLARETPLAAAYIGASNGNRPEFYEIFESAMDAVGITDRRMIDSSFGPDDRAFLDSARLIVLAGGDVRRGWDTFEKTGMKDAILDRYGQGAALVGISAGAVQLGSYGIVETPDPAASGLVAMFDLVPMVVDAHDEGAEWARLAQTIASLQGAATGLGIPTGGGVVVHTDGTVGSLRRPAHKVVFDGNRAVQSQVPVE